MVQQSTMLNSAPSADPSEPGPFSPPSHDAKALGLPHSNGPMVLFRNVTFAIQSAEKKKGIVKLLNNISGFLEPCQMTALLGPSGSGKTTLLDVLAGRKTTGQVTGQILFGGVTPSPAFLRRHTGYVEQHDTLIPSLTVTEMVLYTAELKRSIKEPYDVKAWAVKQLLHRLGLDSCANIRIGDELRKGISGGQAKRTNIAIALIADPHVLFLDEPTSGLDSYSAEEVVEVLQALSREGTTIVSTIHSPTMNAFSMFDQVMVLAQGHMVYFGTLGAAVSSFAQQHWPLQDIRNTDHTSAEFLIEVVSAAERNGTCPQLATSYADSQLCKDNERKLAQYMFSPGEELIPAVHGVDGNVPVPMVSLYMPNDDGRTSRITPGKVSRLAELLNTNKSTSTPWWWSVRMLLKYRARVNLSDPMWVIPRIADKAMFSLILLTLYLGNGKDFDQSNLINICASLFMFSTLPGFGAVAYVPSLVLDRRLFYRERADGMYHVGSYYVAKLLEELVLALCNSIVVSLYLFYGVAYQGSFVLFWLVYLLVLCNGITLGYMVAALSPNLDVANAALPTYCVMLLFFAGQLKTVDSMPSYWSWYSWIDFVRYAWGSVMVNQFEDNNVVFTVDGPTILEYYGLNGKDKWVQFSYLLPFFFVYGLIGYLALAYINHGKR